MISLLLILAVSVIQFSMQIEMGTLRQDLHAAEGEIATLEGNISKVWQDLQFTDYDHRVDLCHLRFASDTERKERCVLTAYRAYCETTGKCTNYRGEGK